MVRRFYFHGGNSGRRGNGKRPVVDTGERVEKVKAGWIRAVVNGDEPQGATEEKRAERWTD